MVLGGHGHRGLLDLLHGRQSRPSATAWTSPWWPCGADSMPDAADTLAAKEYYAMHYPWWYVPYLTAPMLIAVISVVHVLVSHYAVGGGLFLAVEVGHAYRTSDREYLDYLHATPGSSSC